MLESSAVAFQGIVVTIAVRRTYWVARALAFHNDILAVACFFFFFVFLCCYLIAYSNLPYRLLDFHGGNVSQDGHRLARGQYR